LALQKKGICMNVISEMPFEQIRRVVIGYVTGPATVAQMNRMKQLVARSMPSG
jgi:N-acyl-D-aspartate/D-glutamate deacylase